MPFIIGSPTPLIALAVIAPSTALPPRSRTRTPACEARGDSVATIPPREITIDRACPRSCARTNVADNAATQTRPHKYFGFFIFSRASWPDEFPIARRFHVTSGSAALYRDGGSLASLGNWLVSGTPTSRLSSARCPSGLLPRRRLSRSRLVNDH